MNKRYKKKQKHVSSGSNEPVLSTVQLGAIASLTSKDVTILTPHK
jgi:hypothetical protein